MYTLENVQAGPQGNFRPTVFLHLDHTKDAPTIRKWFKWCKGRGFGGVCLAPGGRWEGERMDEGWYSAILDASEAAVKAAAEFGLDIWIFDEWGYPSGTAGGLVAEDPQHRSKKLHVAVDYTLGPGERAEFILPERLVSAGAFPLNKYSFYAPAGHCVPIAGKPGDKISYTAGDTDDRVVCVTWESLSFITHAARENRDDDYSLGTIDLLSAAAAKRFTEVMHDRYYERMSEHFGGTIKGFFYDEPELCYHYPWTPGLEKTFREKKGYDLLPDLPLLMVYAGNSYMPGWAEGYPLLMKLTRDYRDVWTDAVAENFYGVLRDWCHAHGVLSTGHQDMDNHTETLSSVSGDFFKNSKYNDHPGIDVIWDHVELGNFNDFPRFAGSCKRLYGCERAISETFAEMGLGFYPDRMRFDLEQQIVRGVDEFVLMISLLEPAEKTNNCFTPGDMILERFGPEINTHVGRAAQLCNAGMSGANAALYLPMDDIYIQTQKRRDGHIKNSKLSWESVDRAAQILSYMPCDFIYIWDDPLCSLPLGKGGLRSPYGSLIDTIIIPPYTAPSQLASPRLAEFVRQGGRVVTLENPVEKEGLYEFYADAAELVTVIGSPVSAKEGARLSVCVRNDGSRRIFMLLNESAAAVDPELCIPLLDGEELFELGLLTGEIVPICLKNARFEGGELRVFIAARPGEVKAVSKSAPNGGSITLSAYTITLPDGRAQRITNGELPDWAALGFPCHSGDVVYTAEFDCPDGCAGLRVDLGEVRHSAMLSIDGGHPMPLPFAPFTAELPSLSAGKHTLTVTVQNSHANAAVGTFEHERERYGGHTPWYLNTDRKYLKSGLFGPVTITFLK